jgi:hypothetical protein
LGWGVQARLCWDVKERERESRREATGRIRMGSVSTCHMMKERSKSPKGISLFHGIGSSVTSFRVF